MRWVLLALSLVATFAFAGTSAADTPPTITLLLPANGTTVVSSPTTSTYPTFTWHVDWATPENTTIIWQMASDTAFTQDVLDETHFCPASDVNCWTSFQPRRVYSGVLYWRVGMTTSMGIVYSTAFSLGGVPPAVQPDHVKPRVRVLPGRAKRGTQAFVSYHAADDRGEVRLTATLSYRGHVLFRGSFPWRSTTWNATYTFLTKNKIPRYFPTDRKSTRLNS